MIVDLHAHYAPKEYYDKLIAIGGKSLPEPLRQNTTRPVRTDSHDGLPERFERMADADVRLQVLSPAASPPYAEKQDDAVEATRILNDAYAELTAMHPDKLAAFVSLPLPHIDASLRELERASALPGMLGVTINCSVFDRSTAEEEFEPIYEELNRRGAVLFYHPVQNGICSPMINDYGYTVTVGASLEDMAIVLHLIARKIPARYPNIKYVVPHLGGMIPMHLARLDNQGAQNHDLPEPHSVTARRLYYDTVSHGSQAALLCAWKAFGADHLVAGSDYPVLMTFESYKRTFDYIRESDLPPEDIDKILNHNAQIVLGLEH